jgi:hypothetical protein
VTWLINGVQLPNVEFNIGNNWSNYSFNFVSNSTNTTITLLVKNMEGLTKLVFGDVSVTLVPTPTITNFSDVSVPFGTRQIILEPSSNSDGTINFISSQESVATVSGNIVSILGPGETTITLNQEATSSFSSGSVSITLTVIPSSSNNRVIINNKDDLLYFLKTDSSFAKINNVKDITNELLNVLGINKNIV